jgi:hypothetical protein
VPARKRLPMPNSTVSKMSSKTPITRGHYVKYFLAFLLMLIPFNQALSIPVSSSTLPRLTIREEVNPVSEKFATIGDPDMPGLPNFSVLSKDNLSHWEPDSLIMTTTRFIPGQSLASFPLDNGYAPAIFFHSLPPMLIVFGGTISVYANI